ncbi:MAG: PASTA domain-containing protein [Eubacterium sp.]
MNKKEIKRLKRAIKSGCEGLTEEDIKNMIDEELMKDESEIDTDFIDTCFLLLDSKNDQSGKAKIKLRTSAKILIVAAAVLTVFVSTLTVAAQVADVNPIEKIADIVGIEPKKSSSKKQNVKAEKKEKNTKANVELCTVPDFITAQVYYSDVEENEEWNECFDIELVGEYSDDVPTGVIMYQSLEANKKAEKGSRLVLTYSLGVHMQQVPEVYGMTVEEAVSVLKEAGFEVQVVEAENSDGIVASSSITAGEECRYGSEITVYTGSINTPPETEPSTTADTSQPETTENTPEPTSEAQ